MGLGREMGFRGRLVWGWIWVGERDGVGEGDEFGEGDGLGETGL